MSLRNRILIVGFIFLITNYGYAFFPKTVVEICAESGLTRTELCNAGLLQSIEKFCLEYDRLKKKIRGEFFVGTKEYEIYKINRQRYSDYWGSHYQRFLNDLQVRYQRFLTTERQKQEKQRLEESKRIALEQKQHEEIILQLRVNQKKLESFEAYHNQIMEFICLMDQRISTESDVKIRLKAANQILNSDLMENQVAVTVLCNRLKEMQIEFDKLFLENQEMATQLECIRAEAKAKLLALL